jgi:hypothetical protein
LREAFALSSLVYRARSTGAVDRSSTSVPKSFRSTHSCLWLSPLAALGNRVRVLPGADRGTLLPHLPRTQNDAPSPVRRNRYVPSAASGRVCRRASAQLTTHRSVPCFWSRPCVQSRVDKVEPAWGEESSVRPETSNESFESKRLLRFIFVMSGSYRWPTALYSRLAVAPRAGIAVSAFGDDCSRR